MWDVAVIGAGPAGAVTAYTLARLGRSVLLVDDAAPVRRRVGESLPGAVGPLLADLALLHLLTEGPHHRSPGHQVMWGSSTPAAVDLIADPNGLGWHLDRARLDRDLCAAAIQAGAHPCREQLSQLSRSSGGGWLLQLSESTAAAQLVIDATGRRAFVARQLGVTRVRDDALVALIGWLAPQAEDREARTLLEAVREGWWYSARLPDGSRVAVLHTDADEAAAILRQRGAWQQRLADTALLGPQLAHHALLAPVRGTEACGARLSALGGLGWLAVGDAVLSFEPLSGQGLFHAIYTGMRGAQAADAALDGSPGLGQRYGKILTDVRRRYLAHRLLYYRQERRWPDAPFWHRHHQPLSHSLEHARRTPSAPAGP